MKALLLNASALALAAALPATALAQSPSAADAGGVDPVVVTGTRTTGLRAQDSAAPIEVLGSEVLKRVGQPDLVQALAQTVPSIQAQAWGTDQEAFNLTFRLRGLSPNQTLVLVDGQRLHGTANVAVSGGPYGGGAAPDISFIPVGAIDHVEVLTDGAAAQYGTDAIAGVVNIILKKNDSGGQISGTAGQYIDGGGLTGDVSLNVGFKPIDKSYLNVTFEDKFQGLSVRSLPDSQVLNTSAPSNISANILGKYPLLTSAQYYPNVVRITGDPQIRQDTVAFTAGYEITPDIDFYSNGGFGYKDGRHYENFRLPNVVLGPQGQVPFPAGFRPMENQRDTSFWFSAGFKGVVADTTWNLASVYGRDEDKVYVLGSANASLYALSNSSPSNFYDGGYSATQLTNTLDLTHKFDVGLAGPVVLAGGAEYRLETYQLSAGQPSSYFGTGAQSFDGYSPANASSHGRSNWAVYFDAALQPVQALKLDAAVRHEDYSDFGDTTVGKITGRYDFTPAIALRSTVSTGFRAPTLAEDFYSGVNVNPTSISGVFAPNSAGAKALGISDLKPETSVNYSVGVVTHFAPGLSMTLDAYQIQINDRIIQSGTLYGYNSNRNVVTSPSVLQALTGNGVAIDPAIFAASSGSVGVQTFVNGANTRTQGVDFVGSYAQNYGRWGRIDYSLTASYNQTVLTRLAPPPSNVAQSVKLLDAAAISTLENSSPLWRTTLGAYWTLGRYSVNLRESFYGSSFEFIQDPVASNYDKVQLSAAALTDLEVGVRLVDGVKLYAGANNLFNHYPDNFPSNYYKGLVATNSNGTGSQIYPTFSPYGLNGGFYYTRLTWTF
jgi:iron complex outermembrane receptor protein